MVEISRVGDVSVGGVGNGYGVAVSVVNVNIGSGGVASHADGGSNDLGKVGYAAYTSGEDGSGAVAVASGYYSTPYCSPKVSVVYDG